MESVISFILFFFRVVTDRRLHSFPVVRNDMARHDSWPKLVSAASNRYIQSRTFSEPINAGVDDPSIVGSTNYSYGSLGPSKNIRLNLRRRIEAQINIEDIPKIPIIFILGQFIVPINHQYFIELAINWQFSGTPIDLTYWIMMKWLHFFDLGGPGSGKLTHCHHLSQIDEKLVHVNMLTVFLDFVLQTYSKSLFNLSS